MSSEGDYFKHSDESELIRSVKNGDRAAFKEIYERTWELLYNSVFEMLRDKEYAAMVTQETMMSFWINRKKHLHDTIYPNILKELNVVLITFCEFHGIDMEKLKAMKVLTHILLQPSQIRADNDLKECINIWLITETRIRSDIFILRFFEEKTPEEIAALLEMALKAVQLELARIFLSFEAFLKKKDL